MSLYPHEKHPICLDLGPSLHPRCLRSNTANMLAGAIANLPDLRYVLKPHGHEEDTEALIKDLRAQRSQEVPELHMKALQPSSSEQAGLPAETIRGLTASVPQRLAMLPLCPARLAQLCLHISSHWQHLKASHVGAQEPDALSD